MHIFRSFLFLHNKAQAENSGITVVRTTNVVTVSSKGGRSSGPDLTKMNPALRGGPGGPGGGMPPPRRFGRDRMIDKTVMVRKGPFKGLVGIVKDATDEQARVELHSKSKLVTIPKEILVVKEYVCYVHSSLALLTLWQSCYWRDNRYFPWKRRTTHTIWCRRWATYGCLARWQDTNGCCGFIEDARLGSFHIC